VTLDPGVDQGLGTGIELVEEERHFVMGQGGGDPLAADDDAFSRGQGRRFSHGPEFDGETHPGHFVHGVFTEKGHPGVGKVAYPQRSPGVPLKEEGEFASRNAGVPAAVFALESRHVGRKVRDPGKGPCGSVS